MTEPTPPLKPGQRIRLVAMPNDPCPVEPGTTGTVTEYAHYNWEGRTWAIGIKWDADRSLSLCIPPDTFEVIDE